MRNNVHPLIGVDVTIIIYFTWKCDGVREIQYPLSTVRAMLADAAVAPVSIMYFHHLIIRIIIII